MNVQTVVGRLSIIVFIILVTSAVVLPQNPVWQQFNAHQVVYTILETIQ